MQAPKEGYTLEEIEAMFESTAILMGLIQDYAKKRRQIDGSFDNPTADIDDFEEGCIQLRWETYAGCGEYDTEYGYITPSCLTGPDWEALEAEAEAKRRQEAEAAKARAVLQQKLQEEVERSRLRVLLKKYPDEGGSK